MHFFVADNSCYPDELMPGTPTGKSFAEDCQQLFTNYMSIMIDKVAKGEMNWQKNYWDLAQRNPAYSANAIYNRNLNAIDTYATVWRQSATSRCLRSTTSPCWVLSPSVMR